jgi:hypothetical protein
MIERLNRAMSLCPEGKGLRTDLADALVFNGQAREAIALLDETVRSFDPADDYSRWVLAGAHFGREDYGATLLQIKQMSNPAPAFRLAAASRALIGDVSGARRMMKASMDFNPNFDLRKWLAMAPCRSRDFLQRYTEGLKIAGFACGDASSGASTLGQEAGRLSAVAPARHALALSLRRLISTHKQSSHLRGFSDARAARSARCAGAFPQQRIN